MTQVHETKENNTLIHFMYKLKANICHSIFIWKKNLTLNSHFKLFELTSPGQAKPVASGGDVNKTTTCEHLFLVFPFYFSKQRVWGGNFYIEG